MTTEEMLSALQRENLRCTEEVGKVLPQITQAVDRIFPQMQKGGRLFYVGCGTSGRLGVLDASECPPTFGVPDTLVIGILSGGDRALRYSVEGDEDSEMILNMISTSLMVKLGYVYENLMINLKPLNNKLLDRCIRITAQILNCSASDAEQLLKKNNWNIRDTIALSE